MPLYYESLQESSRRNRQELAKKNPNYTLQDLIKASSAAKEIVFKTSESTASHVKINAYERTISLIRVIFDNCNFTQIQQKTIRHQDVVIFSGFGKVRNDDRFYERVYFRVVYVDDSDTIVQIGEENYKVEVEVTPCDSDSKLDDYKFDLEQAHCLSSTIGSFLVYSDNQTFVRNDEARIMDTCGMPIWHFKRVINLTGHSPQIISVSYDNNTFMWHEKKYIYYVKLSMPESDGGKRQLANILHELDIGDFIDGREYKDICVASNLVDVTAITAQVAKAVQAANAAAKAVDDMAEKAMANMASSVVWVPRSDVVSSSIRVAPSITIGSGKNKMVISSSGDITMRTDANGNVFTSSNGTMFINSDF